MTKIRLLWLFGILNGPFVECAGFGLSISLDISPNKPNQPSSTANEHHNDAPPFVKLQASDTGYLYGTISIGNPPQQFNVVFSTIFRYLAVPSVFCKSDGCKGHRKYRKEKSKTYSKFDRDFGLEINGFTGFTGTGFFSNDTVRIANNTIPHHLFVEITRYCPHAPAQPFDGVCGLGFRNKGMDKVKGVFDTLQNHYKKDQNMDLSEFGFHFPLSHDASFYFGKSSRQSYVGTVNVVSLLRPLNAWRIPVDQIFFPDTYVVPKKSWSAIIEPAIDHIAGPATVIDHINKEILEGTLNANDGLFHVDCDQVSEFPDIVFVIHKVPYSIPAELYILMHSPTKCTSRFIELPVAPGNANRWHLGTPFMFEKNINFRKSPAVIAIAEANDMPYQQLIDIDPIHSKHLAKKIRKD